MLHVFLTAFPKLQAFALACWLLCVPMLLATGKPAPSPVPDAGISVDIKLPPELARLGDTLHVVIYCVIVLVLVMSALLMMLVYHALTQRRQ